MRVPFVIALFVLLAASTSMAKDAKPPVAETKKVLVKEYLFRKHRVEVMEALKELNLALSSYLIDHKEWPQCPFDEAMEAKEYSDWWTKTLEPYGIEEKVWNTRGLKFRPGKFKGGALEPYRLVDTPWVTVIGEIGKKPIVGRTVADGSVKIEVVGDKKKPEGKEKDPKPAVVPK